MKSRALFTIVALALTAAVVAQGWRRRRGGGYGDREDARTAREIPSDSTGTPTWANPPAFAKDVFTFVRIKYDYGGWGRGGGWTTDLPDSDLNLSFRLQQMTSMKVDPDGRLLRLTDPDLADFPFIYIVEPGSLSLSEAEIEALRKYLLNGGFLMLDDFWGEREWENCEQVIAQVLPKHPFVELKLDHEIYQRPFLIKSKGQVPNIRVGVDSEFDHITWERWDAQEVHHRGITDDQGRLMVIATHNTDNGDGWEREGESDYYFHNFSEKIAYPLGINILFYVMTH